MFLRSILISKAGFDNRNLPYKDKGKGDAY